MKTSELDILQSIVKNTDMGTHSIESLLNTVKTMDNDLKEILDKHFEEYKTINTQAAQLIEGSGNEVKKQGAMAKQMSKAGIKMNTMIDNSVSHVADMLIQGTTMGIIDVTKELNSKRGNAEKNTVELADKLLHTYQNNIQQYREYL